MFPKLIHLIWLGEDSAGLAESAVEHWKTMGVGREVVLHRDATALLTEWQNAWELAHNASMQSDLLRWSLLLAQGGWYFDCDVRSRLTLDQIEASAHRMTRDVSSPSSAHSSRHPLPIFWPVSQLGLGGRP